MSSGVAGRALRAGALERRDRRSPGRSGSESPTAFTRSARTSGDSGAIAASAPRTSDRRFAVGEAWSLARCGDGLGRRGADRLERLDGALARLRVRVCQEADEVGRRGRRGRSDPRERPGRARADIAVRVAEERLDGGNGLGGGGAERARSACKGAPGVEVAFRPDRGGERGDGFPRVEVRRELAEDGRRGRSDARSRVGERRQEERFHGLRPGTRVLERKDAGRARVPRGSLGGAHERREEPGRVSRRSFAASHAF